jgi:hypothetical protein
MPLILNEDEGKVLGKKQAKVPDKLVNKIKNNLNLFGQYKKSKGYKRASSIVDDDYNKRSNKKDKIKNGDKTLSFSDIKKIDHEFKNMSINDDDANENNLGFILPGGNDMKNWAHDTLRKMRTAVKKVNAVPPVPKLEKKPLKTPDTQKDIKVGNASVRLTENIEYFYENYAYEYGESYVFSQFLEHPEGKQDWGVLINPEMYVKALRELSRFGKLTNSSFPSKYVYQWMGIIMKNTAMLIANTNIMGHSSNFPYEEYEDFVKSYYNNKKEVEVGRDNTRIELSLKDVYDMCGSIKEAADKYGQTYLPWISQKEADELGNRMEMDVMQRKFSQKYGDILDHISAYNKENDSEYGRDGIEIDEKSMKIYWVIDNFGFLDKVGLTDWMLMPDGSDAISDYGIDPIMRIIDEYDESLEPEQVLVIVNKALDVYHQRGDLSSIFIQGGKSSLNRISEEISRNGKKITLTENQLLVLKEFYNQTVFNFDNDGNAYFKKDNWQHYIDFLEEIGKPGTLPASTWDKSDILKAVDEASANISDILIDTPNTEDFIEAFKTIIFLTFVDRQYNDEEVFEPEFLSLFGDDFEKFRQEHNNYSDEDVIVIYLTNIGIFNDVDNLDVYLTYKGNRLFENELNELFKRHFYDYDMMSGMIMNDRGLIYIERNITIPKFNEPTANTKIFGQNYKDFYSLLKDNFTDLGTCFSWEKGGGEAYCGHNYGGRDTEIRLKCWVDPKDINWEETFYRNCYSLNYEQEVYIDQEGAKIEVFDIVLMNGQINGKNAYGVSLLTQPIIITY